VKKFVREMIVFADQDVVSDPPFTNLDLLSCRNLLIYLTPEIQKHVLSLFTYAINPGGVLFLGPAETVGAMTDIFSTIDNKWKIFKRKDYVPKRELAAILPLYPPGPIERANVITRDIEPYLPNLAYQAILENLLPPATLIKPNGDILYISGHTGKYLELAPGKVDMNIIPMARKGIDTELMVAIDKAKKSNAEVVINGVEFILDGKKQAVDIIVKQISKPEAMKNHLLVIFQEIKVQPAGKVKKTVSNVSTEASKKLSEELEYTKQRLRSTTEEMQASREEMRSMNEEMQSTNEELQSTND
jgi:two-component system CheB/CheR fusion protein